MNIFEKLCRIQNDIKAPKTEYNPFGNFKYRNAEGILQMVKPLCLKYEVTLILTDSIEIIEGRLFVKTVAELVDWSVDGESANKVISMPGFAEFPAMKAKTDEAQRTGIASSYAKKRALEALFNLSNEKDSDAYDNTKAEKEAEKERAMKENEEKLNSAENWRLVNGNHIEVKTNGGKWVDLENLELRWLEVLLKKPEFADITNFIQMYIDKFKGTK